jgi:hypothetical protein
LEQKVTNCMNKTKIIAPESALDTSVHVQPQSVDETTN